MIAAHVRSHATVDLMLAAHLLGDEPGLRIGVVSYKDRKIRHVDEAEALDPFEHLRRVAVADNHNLGRPALIEVDCFEHVRKPERLFLDKFAEQAQRPLSLDAVALIAALVKTQGAQRFSQQTLTNPSGFSGIDGLFRFRPDGTNERGLAVLRVTAAGPQTASPPPKSFGNAA